MGRMITSAKYISRDHWRIEYVEDGETKYTRGDQPEFPVIVASVAVADYAETPRAGLEHQDRITSKFWDKVAAHFGVSVDRAKTHIAIMGAPQAVQDYWTKATALMDSPALTKADIEDESNW